MTDKTQPEALRLAEWCDANSAGIYRKSAEAAAELRRQHDRIAELEAELEAVGAGGVQALRAAPAGPWSLGEMTGNWRDIDLPDHGAVMRIVWKMEDDEGRNEELEAQAHAVVAALNAAFSSPPAEQPIGELVVTKTRDGQIVSVTCQDDEGRILSVIATSSPEEQSQPRYSHLHDADALHGKQLSVYGTGATTGAALGGVYAEMPAPNLPRGGFPDLFTEGQMRDFADRTHALRMEQAAPKASPSDIAKLRHLYANLKNGGVRDTAQAKRIADGLLAPIIERLEQAAPKAAPGEPDPADIIAGALQISRGHAIEMMREALEAAPQQEAPKAAPAWEHHARKLTQWLHCMSHNDSYFGEPAGLVKQVTGELNRLIGAAPQQEAQEPIGWAADRVRIEKTEKNGWCAYLDIENEDGYRIGTINLCRGINSENAARTLAQNRVRELVPEPEQVAAPQQEPYAYAVYFPDQPKVELVHDLDELIDDLTNRQHTVTKLYSAPQPAPAPLSDEVLKEVIKDSNRYRWLRRPLLNAGQGSIQVVMDDRLNGKIDRVIFLDELDKAIDAALAAHGGKV